MDVARCIGIAGAGKTTDAMQVIEKIRKIGFSLHQIGFISMTRVARAEASQKASEAFGVPVAELERGGWFKTAHSVCYKMLEVQKDQMLADSKETRKWMEDVIGEAVTGAGFDDDSMSERFRGFSPAAIALRLWDLARGTLRTYREVFERCEEMGGLPFRTPLDFEDASDIVQRYEAAKQRDERLDFTDLLLRYVGMRATVGGCEKVGEPGDVPNVPVWIIDEHQDASILLDMAQRRMTSRATWVYLYGDGDQAIYSFAGANAKNFLEWPASKERRLLKSWRCPRAILEHGRAILELTDGWSSPPWEPRCEGGTVDIAAGEWACEVSASTPTLALTRTNEQAAKMGAELTREGVPWRYYKGNGGLTRPNAVKVFKTIERLKAGDVIDGSEWLTFLGECPSGTERGSCDLIERGTKARFKNKEDLADSFILLHNLQEYGATPKLIDMICSGQWPEVIDGADRVRDAVAEYGEELVENPRVLVATIHGSKGAQASDVFLHAGIPFPVQKAIGEDEAAMEEERRLFYVGSTRASERLVVVKDERGHNFQGAFAGL